MQFVLNMEFFSKYGEHLFIRKTKYKTKQHAHESRAVQYYSTKYINWFYNNKGKKTALLEQTRSYPKGFRLLCVYLYSAIV